MTARPRLLLPSVSENRKKKGGKKREGGGKGNERTEVECASLSQGSGALSASHEKEKKRGRKNGTGGTRGGCPLSHLASTPVGKEERVGGANKRERTNEKNIKLFHYQAEEKREKKREVGKGKQERDDHRIGSPLVT